MVFWREIIGLIGLVIVAWGLSKKGKRLHELNALGTAFLIIYSIMILNVVFLLLEVIILFVNLKEMRKYEEIRKNRRSRVS